MELETESSKLAAQHVSITLIMLWLITNSCDPILPLVNLHSSFLVLRKMLIKFNMIFYGHLDFYDQDSFIRSIYYVYSFMRVVTGYNV